jgi:hypothetical protein
MSADAIEAMPTVVTERSRSAGYAYASVGYWSVITNYLILQRQS